MNAGCPPQKLPLIFTRFFNLEMYNSFRVGNCPSGGKLLQLGRSSNLTETRFRRV
jgi:hypothetical protein